MMLNVHQACVRNAIAALLLAMSLTVSASYSDAKDKSGKDSTAPASAKPKANNIFEALDYSKIVWPNPPAITRIKYLKYWSGEKFVAPAQQKKQSSWMERVAGVTTGETRETKPRWQLVVPNGVAIDSKGKAYVADSKVRAIFIVDVETGEYQMIKNGVDARFQWLTGLAIDDADTLYAADSGLHHVLVFGPNHRYESVVSEGMYDPGGLAIDNENRLLYVTDAEQDLVLVYDADPPYKLLRKIGKPDTKHTSTVPGQFARPTGVAVDQDGNVYVSDTFNDRIEVFDAEGKFIRTFGKAGDGPGYFARPKGIAIDSDGHVWVADAVQDRVQVFTPTGHLLIYLGGHGILPGQFQSLTNLAIDRTDRVFTTEQMAGRMQIFKYIPNADAKAEKARRDEQAKKRLAERSGNSAPASNVEAGVKSETPAQK